MDETPDTPDVSALDGGIRYTMAEAARLKGVSYHTVSRAVRSGKLPAQRLGRMALIAAQDLHAWRPMRERAPRKYRRSQPDGANGQPPAPALGDAPGGYLDRLVIAGEQVLAVASAESSAGFGPWLARWLAQTLRTDLAVIWKLDETHRRASIYGAFGLPEAAEVPGHLDGSAAKALQAFAEQEGVATLDGETAALLRTEEWLGAPDESRPVLVPLRSGSRCVGCAVVARRGEQAAFSPEENAFAQRLGLHGAFAMEHVEMREASRGSMVANESLLRELPIQLMAVDGSGCFVYANRAFIDMWGEELHSRYIGRHFSHLLRSYRVETFDGVEVRVDSHPITLALRGQSVHDFRLLVPEAPGETRAFVADAMPTYDAEGAQTGAILLIREITGEFAGNNADRSPIELLADARRRVELLASLSTEIAERRNSEDIFALIASRGSDILEADAAFLVVPAPDNQVVIRATHNMPDGFAGRQLSRFTFPLGLLAMANRDLSYVSEDDATATGREIMRQVGSRVALLVPLVDGEEALGVLALQYREVDTLQRVDPELARAVGRQCGHAVQLHNVVVELEASRRRLLTTLDQLPQAVVITDEPEGHIVAMNREAQELWGPSANWLGQHVSDITVLDEQGRPYTPDQHPFLRPLRTRATDFGVPLITRDAKDALVDVVANVAPVVGRNGDLRGAVAVLQRREHFKPIDQAKDEFISVVAHELRNPLTSLRGNLQMLERRLKRIEADEAQREVTRVVGVIEQVDRVGDLVSRMLDVSRADLGKLTIAPGATDAVQLAESVIRDLESQAGDRRMTLHAPETLPVEWDAVRVQQILVNLVTNAMRYAPEGDIDVTVSEAGDAVAISVRDHGPGVPLRLRRRLFRLYYRFDDGEESADSMAMQHRGLGIGLYISARLARAHGGDLSVDDADGGGAVFTLTLPRTATQDAGA